MSKDKHEKQTYRLRLLVARHDSIGGMLWPYRGSPLTRQLRRLVRKGKLAQHRDPVYRQGGNLSAPRRTRLKMIGR